VATFMIIVKSPGNGLIVILHRTGGGQTERVRGGGLYGKRIKGRKQIKSLAFSGSSLKEPSQQIVKNVVYLYIGPDQGSIMML